MLVGKGINRSGDGIIRAAYGSKKNKKINSASLLANLEIQKYHQNETRFNEVCSR